MLSPTQVLHLVVTILERLGIPYMVGGSVAGSIYGIPRMTHDADLVVDLKTGHVRILASAFEAEFYVSEEAMAEALLTRGTFNIIHLESMFKVDFFVLSQRAFDQQSFANRRTISDPTAPGGVLVVCGPEELVVTKLEWYRIGGCVSDRQYRDVVGILKTQSEAGTLDERKLRRLAAQLDLTDLLERTMSDSASSR